MKTPLLTISIFLVVLNCSVFAQENRLSFELNTGMSYATRSLGGADLNIGGGFEGIFQYKVMPHVNVLAGWGWNKFSSEESFAGTNIDFEETGYIFGFQFMHPLFDSDLKYYIRANGLYNHIELENSSGDIIEDTGHGFGWQIAGGVSLPINSKWDLTPGIKFNTLKRDLNTDSYSKTLKENYLSLRIGVLYHF